jgi:hypothetical protein
MFSHRTPSSHPFSELAGVTRLQLEAFRARRSLLRLCSVCSAAVVVLVVLLALAMLLDSLWLHAAAPWIGALPLYLVTLTLLGYVCLSPRLEGYDLRVAAQRMEQRDSRLREKLLSAVELSDSHSAVVDSGEFRAHLQREVAQLMRCVDVKQLLPWAQVRVPITLAT